MKHFQFLKFSLFLVFCGLLLVWVGCGSQYYTMDDYSKVEKIDIHVHANADNSAFLDQAKADNFRIFTINVDYSDFPPIEEQLDVARSLKSKDPERIAYASTFHMAGWDSPDWQQKTINHLDSTFAVGAVAVKVWKNIGMEFLDTDSNLVMLDDPKFDMIFRHLHDKNIPLFSHAGEPKDCWLPYEEMMVNGDKEYFSTHPQYYMYLHPEMPSYEEQMAVRDRMLEKNKDLVFIGVHLASLEWSVDEVAKFLDRFPMASVDIAARSGQVQYQSSQDREKVRQFFIKYQDRVLYGTDLVHDPDARDERFKKEVHKKWLSDWKYFNTDSTMTVPDLDNSFQGLALPAKVIDKFYRTNAKKLFPQAWSKEEI
jgi:predicted TIM-barrel fold metal-dependent hydrolase